MLRSGLGHDELHGDDGADVLYADNGNDTLDGGAGEDELFGERGSDHLNGGDGNDVLAGVDDNDFLTGGDGADIFTWYRYNTDDYGIDHITGFNTKPATSLSLALSTLRILTPF